MYDATGAHRRVNMLGQHSLDKSIPICYRADHTVWKRREAAQTGQSKLTNRSVEGYIDLLT
jgi:hypothetical protein